MSLLLALQGNPPPVTLVLQPPQVIPAVWWADAPLAQRATQFAWPTPVTAGIPFTRQSLPGGWWQDVPYAARRALFPWQPQAAQVLKPLAMPPMVWWADPQQPDRFRTKFAWPTATPAVAALPRQINLSLSLIRMGGNTY